MDRSEPEGAGNHDVSPDIDVELELVEGRLDTGDVDGFLDSVEEIAERHAVAAQAFDTRYLESPRHLEHAVSKARRACERGEEVADTFAMEVMLYVAGTRQISVATETGVRAGGCDTVVALTPPPGARETQTVPEPAVEETEALLSSEEVDYLDRRTAMEFFEVSDEEMEAVGEQKLGLLVLERVALLDVNK